MKTLYLIELSGQGDNYFSLVEKEICDWIWSDETPGRENDESGWYDLSTPEILKKKKLKEFPGEDEEPYDGLAYVTNGSLANDRALFANNFADIFF